METIFTKSEPVYIAGSNQDQRNWRIDIYENGLIFCTVFGKTRDHVEENAKLVCAASDLFEALDLSIRKLKAIGEGDSIAVKTGLIAIQKATE